MVYLSECEAGQTVSFNYDGGSTPGRLRVVKIDKVCDDMLLGTDQEIDESRWFVFAKARNVRLVGPRVRKQKMSFVEARDRLHEQIDELDAEGLVEVMVQLEGHDRGYFDVDKAQVVLEIDVHEPKFNLCSNGFTISNEDGECTTIQFDVCNGRVTAKVDGEEVTPEEMVEQLTTHLSY